MVDEKGIREREPECRGIRALWSPHTGIVDWGEVLLFPSLPHKFCSFRQGFCVPPKIRLPGTTARRSRARAAK